MPSDLSSDEVISFFEHILNRGLSLRTKVTGRSMAPFLNGGEILEIKRTPSSSLRIGDLIFFKDGEGFVVLHRIVGKQRKDDMFFFRTKGDALLRMDHPVSGCDVLGRVCRIEKLLKNGKIKRIDMESGLRRSFNYLIAVIGLYRSRLYFGVQGSGLYSSFRSIVKKVFI